MNVGAVTLGSEMEVKGEEDEVSNKARDASNFDGVSAVDKK